MNDRTALYDGYRKYKLDCRRQNQEALDYDEWLAEVAVRALSQVSVLADEVAHYQHAAESTHEKWVEMRAKVDQQEALLCVLQYKLWSGDYDAAALLVAAASLGN